VGPAQKINLEYDPSAPEIIDAYADPDLVTEGIETTLHVNTDDKTLCRYDEGEAEYGTMQYSFPGEEDSVLEIEHEDIFTISFSGASKTYNLTTQCRNGADNLSEVERFNFFVDYSVLGNIISLEPSGYIAVTEVTLKVLTNKNAMCSHDGEVFEITGGTEHTQLVNVGEGEHIYLVHCQIGEEERDGVIEFTVDLTAPVITEIEDGNISCGLDETPGVFVSTNEEAISGYSYELYDRGNTTSGAGTLVKTGTVGSEVPFKVSVDLSEGHTYYFKIAAGDAAGNWGTSEESDGFLAVPSSDGRCEEDEAPVVSFVVDETCTKTIVEMECDDETSCDIFDYGKSFVSDLCEAADSYSGQNILFEKTGWICYYVTDVVGNEGHGIKKINFYDEDGDGIADDCDECPDTGAGKSVDEMGCTLGQVSDDDKEEDTDNDGLPDYWEKLYDAIDCELDYTNDDSDFDEVFDGDEDYDGDDYTNYDEYRLDYNPCVGDAPPEDVEEDVVSTEVVGEVSVWAWVLFVLGLLMLLGGSGYLVYYYRFALKPAVQVRPRAVGVPAVPVVKVSPLKERMLALRKTRKEKVKTRERQKLFGEFSSGSKVIPHVEEAIKRKGPPLKRLGDLAKRHAAVKRLVKPGLKPGEKGVFAKLEKIARETKKKDIEDVVSKEEAKNIFDKLKEISKRRKK
jgi:hypothetical protein